MIFIGLSDTSDSDSDMDNVSSEDNLLVEAVRTNKKVSVFTHTSAERSQSIMLHWWWPLTITGCLQIPTNQQKANGRRGEKCDSHPSNANSNNDVAKTQTKNKADDIVATKQRGAEESDVAKLDLELKTTNAQTRNEAGEGMEVEEPEDDKTADAISDDEVIDASSSIDAEGADNVRTDSHGAEVRGACVYDMMLQAEGETDRHTHRERETHR